MGPRIEKRPPRNLDQMEEDCPSRDADHTHAVGQKRPSIFGGRRLSHRKAAVNPIEWTVTQRAIRHEAMKSFESINDPIKLSRC